MSQPAFDFRAPLADVRSTAPDGTPVPPTNGRSPGARQASQSGADAIRATWTQRQRAYLTLLEQAGPLTDHAAAARLGWPLCSINSVRGALRDRVVEAGSEEHHFVDVSGARRHTWRTRWMVA